MKNDNTGSGTAPAAPPRPSYAIFVAITPASRWSEGAGMTVATVGDAQEPNALEPVKTGRISASTKVPSATTPNSDAYLRSIERNVCLARCDDKQIVRQRIDFHLAPFYAVFCICDPDKACVKQVLRMIFYCSERKGELIGYLREAFLVFSKDPQDVCCSLARHSLCYLLRPFIARFQDYNVFRHEGMQ